MKNPHVVVAYLTPSTIALATARVWRYRPPNILVVFLNREDKTFSTVEVQS